MNMIALSLIGLLAVIVVSFSTVLVLRKDTSSLLRVVGQATSGRWLLTIAAAICLLLVTGTDAWFAIKHFSTEPNARLPFEASTIFTLIGGVFTFYFLKPTDSDSGDSKKEDPKKSDTSKD